MQDQSAVPASGYGVQMGQGVRLAIGGVYNRARDATGAMGYHTPPP